VSRVPIRKWKQGLNLENLAIDHTKYGLKIMDFKFPSYELGLTIRGIFPTLEDALKLMKDKKYTKCAFTRNWAVDKVGSLLFRGRIVGKFHKGKFTLNKDEVFLLERFKAETGENCDY
jgi:hypothetical protein